MPPTVDLRGLDPPGPLLRILEAIETDPSGPHVFLLPREPWPLYPLLKGSGWRHTVSAREDGWELTLRRDRAEP